MTESPNTWTADDAIRSLAVPGQTDRSLGLVKAFLTSHHDTLSREDRRRVLVAAVETIVKWSRLGMHRDATSYARELIEMARADQGEQSEAFAEAHLRLGRVLKGLQMSKQIDEEIRALQVAASGLRQACGPVDARVGTAYDMLGSSLADVRRWPEAREALQHALVALRADVTAMHEMPQTLFLLGKAHEATGHPEAAIEALDECLSLFPTAEVQEQKGHALVSAGRLDEALALAQEMAAAGGWEEPWRGFESRRRAASGDLLMAMAFAVCPYFVGGRGRVWSAGAPPIIGEGEPWAVAALTVQVAHVLVSATSTEAVADPPTAFRFYLHAPASWLSGDALAPALRSTFVARNRSWAETENDHGPGWSGDLYLPTSWTIDSVLSSEEIAAAPWRRAKPMLFMAAAWSVSRRYRGLLQEGIKEGA